MNESDQPSILKRLIEALRRQAPNAPRKTHEEHQKKKDRSRAKGKEAGHHNKRFKHRRAKAKMAKKSRQNNRRKAKGQRML